MNWFQELLSNGFLLVALSSWFWAQLIKTILHAIVTKRVDLTRLVGDGGMAEWAIRPRSHRLR